MRRRVWCETLSFEELCAPAVITLLARYRLDVLLAVRPWHASALAEVVARLCGAGLEVSLWPMLEDERGRWASVASLPAFVALVDDLLSHAPEVGEVVVDLEPAMARLARWKPRRNGTPLFAPGSLDSGGRRHGGAGNGLGYRRAITELSAAVLRWRDAGAQPRRVTTAVMPLVPFDGRGQWVQRALGTPVDELPVHRHSVMAYTSLIEGWSRGVVDRRRAEWLLSLCARRSRARWGERAAVSLGAVGAGAFGDEPVLRSPAELARDVAIAHAAGVTEISLFDLGGVLRRPPPEAWLEALCNLDLTRAA